LVWPPDPGFRDAAEDAGYIDRVIPRLSEDGGADSCSPPGGARDPSPCAVARGDRYELVFDRAHAHFGAVHRIEFSPQVQPLLVSCTRAIGSALGELGVDLLQALLDRLQRASTAPLGPTALSASRQFFTTRRSLRPAARAAFCLAVIAVLVACFFTSHEFGMP
jgi:hypothetical protein